MTQNRTHTCGELRASHAGQEVKLSGWMENIRIVSAGLAFIVIRDFYGTTQVVAESEEMVNTFRHLSWAAAATTNCPSKSTAAGRPTKPSG